MNTLERLIKILFENSSGINISNIEYEPYRQIFMIKYDDKSSISCSFNDLMYVCETRGNVELFDKIFSHERKITNADISNFTLSQLNKFIKDIEYQETKKSLGVYVTEPHIEKKPENYDKKYNYFKK